MRVLKFGGTSLGSAARIKNAAQISLARGNCLVVCSAMAGITNELEGVAWHWKQGEKGEAREKLHAIRQHFKKHTYQLFEEEAFAKEVLLDINKMIVPYTELLNLEYSKAGVGHLLMAGESITSFLFCKYLAKSDVHSELLDALDIIHLNGYGEPEVKDIAHRIREVGLDQKAKGIYVTQGFICRDARGQITNLKRGGSDYTATLMGAAINAETIEIWTDIDGLHNNDPRFVENTLPVRKISYDEASELAYFGAKILHPSCVWPARDTNIPVEIKNTLQPDAPGTTIHSFASTPGIRAVSAKNNIAIVRITSGRMVNAYGFLKKVFAVFDDFKLPVDVITTSEVSVSVTIEDDTRLEPLVRSLGELGRVDVERDQLIVCVVGEVMSRVSEIMEKVETSDVRMVSVASSGNNLTMVLPCHNRAKVLQSIHSIFLQSKTIKSQLCKAE